MRPSASPAEVEAHYQHARGLVSRGQLGNAVRELQRVLALQPRHLGALIDLGITLAYAGQYQSALTTLKQAKRADPRHPAELHFGLGLCHLGLGELPEADSSFRAADRRGLRNAELHNNWGLTLFQMQRYPEAIERFRQAIVLYPGFAGAMANLGDALLRAGDVPAAVRAYRDAVGLQPADALMHAALGTALLLANQLEAATTSLERALQLDPQLADVAVNLAMARRRLQRFDEASVAYNHALSVRPSHPVALLELGLLHAERGNADEAARLLVAAQEQQPQDVAVALQVAERLDALGRRQHAVAAYERATGSLSANAEIREAHGRLLHRLGRLREAMECYERALAIEPTRRSALINRGHVLEALGALPDAMDCFRSILEADPADQNATAGLASCAFRVCDWNAAEAATARLLASSTGVDALHPFLRFALDLDPAALAACSRRTANAVKPAATWQPLGRGAHERVRVAYLSPDFRQHPVAQALAPVIEHHDRSRIECIGVALAAPDDSDIAARLRTSFDEFIDCSAHSDSEVVTLLRQRQIDIAIDLAGFTAGARPSIFAARIAPTQVNYLGFAGSTGASYMDWLLADGRVIPPGDEQFYSERIIRMPQTYLPFDDGRTVAPRPARREAGLPEAGFVFCAFSNGYKISRAMFAIWLRLLQAVPGSVLWLRSGAEAMQANLTTAAVHEGVAPERLVFAPFVAQMDQYLARLSVADLFLDTVPYNAHTTAAEALWAGVPMVSCRGRSFAGRVGSSLLTAAGLPELVCADPEHYYQTALRLASSPQELAALRAQLEGARHAGALFHTGRYVSELDSVLTSLRQSQDSTDCNIPSL
jgi:predicted O-linked N-acetylglucosamine transferase (SPINDLY family)